MLCIETSGKSLGVALWGPQGLIDAAHVHDGARHGAALAPMILELLERTGLKVNRLGALGVSLGPGSWTGLRIGLAAAKALAWGASLTLVGVPSLEALALAALRPCGKEPTPGESPSPTQPLRVLVTVRHAYTEGLYVALWRETSKGPERLLSEQVLRPDSLPAAILEALNGLQLPAQAEVRLCGDAVCLKALAEQASTREWRVQPGFEEVPVVALAERAWARLVAGASTPYVWRTPAEIHAAAPLYLRASDPELKLKRKQAS